LDSIVTVSQFAEDAPAQAVAITIGAVRGQLHPFNESPAQGGMSHKSMTTIVHERYDV
jgi:hypothetical protein